MIQENIKEENESHLGPMDTEANPLKKTLELEEEEDKETL